LPRREREQAIAHHAARYAARLEYFCRKAPLQWFNFFDFWQRPEVVSKEQGAVTDE
jgi:predicted LPLAT superfamily acyltransferase